MGYVAKSIDASGMMEFWGNPVNLTLTNVAAEYTLSDVDIPNIPGIAILAAYGIYRIGAFKDSSASENEGMACSVQVDKAAAGWTNAIVLNGNYIRPLASTPYNNITNVGEIDIKARVALGATTNFRLYQGYAASNGISCWNTRCGVRILW